MNTWTTLTRRCIAPLVVTSSLPCACTSSDKSGRRTDDTSWTVRVQGIGSEIESCDASLLGWRGGPLGHRIGILELSDSSPLARRYGAFAGIEGAPIFDASGAFVGAVVSSIGQPECRLCAFSDAASLDRLWSAGRRCLSLLSLNLAPAPAGIEVRAGDAVALARWWTDAPGVSREFGTIAEVRGDQAILITTATHMTPMALRGTDLQVLLFARTIAIGSMTDRFARVVAAGAPIGTVVYRGAQGQFVILGRLPPSITLRAVVHVGKTTQSIDVHIVHEGVRTVRNVSEFLTTFFREAGLARRGSARVSFSAGDHPQLETSVTTDEDSTLDVTVDRTVSDAIASSALPPELSLAVDVTLE